MPGWYVPQMAEDGMTVGPPGDKIKSGLEAIGSTMSGDDGKDAGTDGKAIIDAFNTM